MIKLAASLVLLTSLAVGQEQDHKATLTAQDMVSILAEYDVRHGPQQPFFQPSYGATQFEVVPPVVWIFDGTDHEDRMSTVIHEMIHIKCHKLHVECTEEQVRAAEADIYSDLFLK